MEEKALPTPINPIDLTFDIRTGETFLNGGHVYLGAKMGKKRSAEQYM